MGDFNWDKGIFGELAPEVEKVVGQAMSYAKKTKAEELEKTFSEKENEYKTKLSEYQGKVQDIELSQVDDTNKGVVKALLQTQDLNTVKEQYPHLFKSNVISAEQVLGNSQVELNEEEIRVLTKEKNNQILTNEEKVIWSRAILKNS